ncbi:MAG TPA: acyl-CoA dehydrogenase family protein [Acidimicrobiia bacterium]|jgi:alkylation response protein AidB-like acyl-CoA dehydrogenase
MRLRADLAGTPQLRALREELSAWLGEHLTDEFRSPGLADPTGAEGDVFERRRAWQRVLHSGGWVGIHWPAAHGGRSAGLMEHAVYLLECAAAGALEPVNTIGINMVGPTLIEHGTDDQLALLPRILSADAIWSQLFSEPEAGSDLGAIATRARPTDDGGWVVTGQKVWTSWGTVADLGLLVARTGDKGFRGLSCFVLDMHSPGITVRGLRQMSGDTHFAEVFLDDVVLPPGSLIGKENEGWTVASTTLAHERTTAILSRHATTLAAAAKMLELAGRPGTPPATRDRALAVWSEAQVFCLNGYRGVAETARGGSSPATWLQRMQWGLVTREIFETAQSLRGGAALLADDPDDPDAADWCRLLLASRGWTIGGGTTEIQRNMLGEKVLGLPREPKAVTAS